MYFKYTLNELIKNYRDFFETDVLHNFYYINNKDMSIGNLHTAVITPNRIIVDKTRKALKISMYFKLYYNALVKNFKFFIN